MLSFLEILVGVRKRLDFYRSNIFWQSDENKKKYRLLKWNIICRPKDQGGLGIEVLELKNKCLLRKWLFFRRRICGRNCYLINTKKTKRLNKLKLNQQIHSFGKD
jgi:hypothetical protein